MLRIAPTNVWARGVFGIEDYRKNSFIPIQYMETILRLFLMCQKEWIYSEAVEKL